VRQSARTLLGVDPEVFTISARAALRGKTGSPAADVQANRFADLERYVSTTLDQGERIRLKLQNPLGVAMRLNDRYRTVVDERLAILKDDVLAIDDIERQLAVYRDDLNRDFRYRLSHVDNVLHEFERRGIAFFDDTLRLARIFDLLNKGRLKADFERQVVRDMPQLIERSVHEVIDWMVASDLRHWQGVMERIASRRAAHADRLVGDIAGTFNYDRARLLDTVGRAAEHAVESYDQEREANEMAESVRMAVAGTALAEAGAISLGAVVTALATTTLADVTGILAASALAVIGLFVIPVRRQQAKDALREKIEAMRRQLMETLTHQFDREVERSTERVHEAIAPYTRFVRAEQARLVGLHSELTSLRDEIAGLQKRAQAV
jgi:hypothetical protein